MGMKPPYRASLDAFPGLYPIGSVTPLALDQIIRILVFVCGTNLWMDLAILASPSSTGPTGYLIFQNLRFNA
jgi:hypothetical protein